jgi:hypothetical protein
MLAKKPPKPFMIDPLAGTLLKLLLFFGGLLWAVLPVVVGALWQVDRLNLPA